MNQIFLCFKTFRSISGISIHVFNGSEKSFEDLVCGRNERTGAKRETGLLFATMYLKHQKEDTGNKVAY